MGVKVPGSEMARERKFQGANWPESYWNFRSRERIGPGAKRPGTLSTDYLALRYVTSLSLVISFPARGVG